MTPDEEKACTTEAFLVAVGQVGSDPAKAATDLSVFAPDPSVLAIDEAVMGPQGAGRTAELFAQRTTPLATILCLYVRGNSQIRAAEYRRASCPGTVMMLEGPTNEVLSHPQLGEHARYMPTLSTYQRHLHKVTQWATSMMEKNAIGEVRVNLLTWPASAYTPSSRTVGGRFRHTQCWHHRRSCMFAAGICGFIGVRQSNRFVSTCGCVPNQ